MELLAVGWLICGFAAAVVGWSKGRNGCLWFVGGVLLGPIGLLMVGFMPKVEPKAPPAPPMRICPFCAEEVQLAAIVCKHCRRDLPQEAREEHVAMRAAAKNVEPDDQNTGMMALGVVIFTGAIALIAYGYFSR